MGRSGAFLCHPAGQGCKSQSEDWVGRSALILNDCVHTKWSSEALPPHQVCWICITPAPAHIDTAQWLGPAHSSDQAAMGCEPLLAWTQGLSKANTIWPGLQTGSPSGQCICREPWGVSHGVHGARLASQGLRDIFPGLFPCPQRSLNICLRNETFSMHHPATWPRGRKVLILLHHLLQRQILSFNGK